MVAWEAEENEIGERGIKLSSFLNKELTLKPSILRSENKCFNSFHSQTAITGFLWCPRSALVQLLPTLFYLAPIEPS